MAIFLSPSVITREIDVSDYPASVSTTVCAMVGTAVKGPVNVPQYITNPEQFITTFGYPTTSSYLGYAALAYLEKGSQLWVNRIGATVGSDKLTKASRSFKDGQAATITAGNTEYYNLPSDFFIRLITNGTSEQKVYFDQGFFSAAQVASEINRQASGVYADANATSLRLTSTKLGPASKLEFVEIDNSIFNFSNVTAASVTGTVTETYNVTASNNKIKLTINGNTTVTVTLAINPAATAADVANQINLITLPYGMYADGSTGVVVLQTSNAGSGMSIIIESVTASAYALLGFTEGTYNGTSTIPVGTVGVDDLFTITAINEGTWGNEVTVVINGVVDPNSGDRSFNLSIMLGDSTVEAYQNVLRGAANVSDDNYIERLINGISTYITVSDDTTKTGNPRDLYSTDITLNKLQGGKDGIVGVTDADYIGYAFDTSLQRSTGLNAFADAEKINVNLLMVPGISSAAVISSLLSISEARADAMTIIDTPFGLAPQDVVAWVNNVDGNNTAINSSYGAVYYDWLKVYDAYNKTTLYVPPTGYVAANYAYNDFVADPWFAPAGLNRGRITTAIGVRYSPTKGERDLLYTNNVNPIVNFITDGITIWGQKTAQRKSSALDRVNVRRLLLYLRKVAANVSRFFVFEPNDPALWRRVRYTFEPLLSDVQSRRGITEYKVICDSTINTPARVDRNELWVRILLKPTKAVEFIQVDFVILPQGASLEAELII